MQPEREKNKAKIRRINMASMRVGKRTRSEA